MDNFPVIETDTGLVDKIRHTIKTGVLFSIEEIGNPGYCERYDFIREFGYVIPTKELIESVYNMNRSWVSVCSGRGYLEYIMAQRGINIIATDLYPVSKNPYFSGFHVTTPYIDIECIDALAACHKYSSRDILMAWPPADSLWPLDVVKFNQGKYLLYVGEGKGGCTACDAFHAYLNTCVQVNSIPHANFIGINDYALTYKL